MNPTHHQELPQGSLQEKILLSERFRRHSDKSWWWHLLEKNCNQSWTKKTDTYHPLMKLHHARFFSKIFKCEKILFTSHKSQYLRNRIKISISKVMELSRDWPLVSLTLSWNMKFADYELIRLQPQNLGFLIKPFNTISNK